MKGIEKKITKILQFVLAISPEQGAQTTLYCCLEPKLANESGNYYANCQRKKLLKHACDEQVALRLWNVTCDLLKINH